MRTHASPDRLGWALVSLLTAALACSPISALQPTSAPAAASPQLVPSATPIRPTSQPASQPPTSEPVTLAEEGPWWVFSRQGALYAVNDDGSGLTQIHQEPPNSPFNGHFITSPKRGYIAYLSGADSLQMKLNINVLPSRFLIAEIPLTTFVNQEGSQPNPGDPLFQALEAVRSFDSMAFSPDGTKLAFMGLLEGPTSDLYVYDIETSEITRLTDGPSQSYQPVWSPDGRYIAHTGANNFGTGAGYQMAGVWAAKADGSEVISLYEPIRSGDEVIVAWLDENTLISYSWTAACSPRELRAVNVSTGKVQLIWPGYFQSAAFNPNTGQGYIGNFFESCSPGKLGLYWVLDVKTEPMLLVPGQVSRLEWDPSSGYFLLEDEIDFAAISPEGDFWYLNMPPEVEPKPALNPERHLVAWPGPALWYGAFPVEEGLPNQIAFDEQVYEVTWSPDGSSMLFSADSGLYAAWAANVSPRLIDDGMTGPYQASAWVVP